jgi:hypothetical protein
VRYQVDEKAIRRVQAIFTNSGHAAEIAWVIGVL